MKNDHNSFRLTNIIAFIGAAATFFMLLVLVYFFGWPAESNRWYMVGTIFLYLLVPVLNKAGFHLSSKYLLCYTPVLFCFVVSIVNKKIGPIFINDYYVYRIVLITASIVPILLLRYNQYLHLILCTIPVLAGLVFFDKIHELFDVGIFQTDYEDATYFMTTFTSVACYFALVGFIYVLKRKNDIYLEDIFLKNELLETQNKTLAGLNNDIESRNRIISDQNEQLKGFSAQLKDKVEKRTKELTRLNKELAEQNVKLEQFTFITAHNLKSPVTQIKGLLNLLNYDEELQDNSKEIFNRIQTSCTNLEEVISDLNKILNIKNSGHIVEKINISEISDHIVANLKPDLLKNNVMVKKEYDAVIEMLSIRAFVYSVIYNIIQNAVKYSDQEKLDSYISINITQNWENIIVTVTDNGIGFEQEIVKDKLFQLYQRFNTNVQGKGMGLFLVKTQLEMINGKINVKSEVGKGTTFEITLPKKLN